jgi:Flp pilus assembly protein CpaB
MSLKALKSGVFINRNRIISGLFLILAAAVFVSFIYPRHIAVRPAAYSVVSAARAIPEGCVILESDLRLSETPDASLAKTVFADKNEVIGKTATRDISAGEYIFSGDVAYNHTPETIYNTLPEGGLMISIALDSPAQSVAGQLRAGDIIRIYSLRENGSAYTPKELRYVKVLAVYDRSGREIDRASKASAPGSRAGITDAVSKAMNHSPNDGSSFTGSDSHDGSGMPALISLLVTQEQALRIVELESRSSYYFTLVSRDDAEKASQLLGIQQEELAWLAGGHPR